jgi:hypothetical protein
MKCVIFDPTYTARYFIAHGGDFFLSVCGMVFGAFCADGFLDL